MNLTKRKKESLKKKTKRKRKKKKSEMDKMMANKSLEENDKVSRVCVRLFDGSSIYIFE